MSICPQCGRQLRSTRMWGWGWAVLGVALVTVLALFLTGSLRFALSPWRRTTADSLRVAAQWLAEAPAAVLPTVILPPTETPTVTPSLTATSTATRVATQTATASPSPTQGPTATPTSPGATYKVRSGDTPASIALGFGISADELMKANDIYDPGSLQVGQVLLVPQAASSGDDSRATATRVSATVVVALSSPVATASSTRRVTNPGPAATGTQTATPTAAALAASGPTRYVVVAGDTPSGIAADFGVTIEALLQANDLEAADLIRPGDELIIPSGLEPEVTPTSTPLATPVPSSEATATPTVEEALPAPMLLSPEDGESVTIAADDGLELVWEESAELGEEQEYVVHVGYVDASNNTLWLVASPQEQPLRAARWEVPLSVFDPVPDGVPTPYRWFVQVERVVRNAQGVSVDREVLSPPSEIYTFVFSWASGE